MGAIRYSFQIRMVIYCKRKKTFRKVSIYCKRKRTFRKVSDR